MGKSRSTTLLIAYLLSKSTSPSTSPTTVLRIIRECRPHAEPNRGFMKQLKLYHRMGCPADIDSHPMYQRWLYEREVESSVACRRAPETKNIYFGDEIATNSDAEKTTGEMNIRCRKCRQSLATSAYLIQHVPKTQQETRGDNVKSSNDYGPISSLPATKPRPFQCAHLFLDPLSWMRPQLELGNLDGRLACPNEKCKTNVGKYAWQGMMCSCGEWIVPGISLARGRIDEINTGTIGPVVPAKISGKI